MITDQFTPVPLATLVAAVAASLAGGAAMAQLAAAGTNAATAAPLPAQTNVLVSVPAGTGVIDPGVPLGTEIAILNRGANVALLYPRAGAQFEALGAGNPAPLQAGGYARFKMLSATQGFVY